MWLTPKNDAEHFILTWWNWCRWICWLGRWWNWWIGWWMNWWIPVHSSAHLPSHSWTDGWAGDTLGFDGTKSDEFSEEWCWIVLNCVPIQRYNTANVKIMTVDSNYWTHPNKFISSLYCYLLTQHSATFWGFTFVIYIPKPHVWHGNELLLKLHKNIWLERFFKFLWKQSAFLIIKLTLVSIVR